MLDLSDILIVIDLLAANAVAAIVIIGLLAANVVAAIVVILLLARIGAYFGSPAQGTTTYITASDKLQAIWPNVGGFKMSTDADIDGRHWLVPSEDETERMKSFFYKSLSRTVWFQKWLWKRFGIRFISWFWWLTVRVHSFDIRSRLRLLEGASVKPGMSLKDRVVKSDDPEGTKVKALLFLVPRPVHLSGMQLAGDNARINLLLLPIYRQIIPSLPVFYLKGDFFTPLDAAIEAMVVDFFATHRVAVYKKTKATEEEVKGQLAHDFYELPYNPPKKGTTKEEYGKAKEEYDKRYKEDNEEHKKEYDPSFLTYNHWLKLSKGGPNSPMERHLRSLNISKAYRDRLEVEGKTELSDYIDSHLTVEGSAEEMSREAIKKAIPSGIIPRFGFALISFRVVDWEPHSDTSNLAKALLQKETRFHEAEGVRQEAYGVRDAILARATGESSRYKQLADSLIEREVSPDVAAEVVRTQIRTENIGGKDSKVVTYVEGGSPASVMVPAQGGS